MTWLVARRELRTRWRARSARVFTAILLVAVAAAVVIPALVSGGESVKRVGVVGANQRRAGPHRPAGRAGYSTPRCGPCR